MNLTNSLCDTIFTQYPLDVKQQVIAILKEMETAELKHPAWPIDPIHAAAIVAEESGELIQAANQYAHERGKFCNMQHEAVQVGCTAIRFLVNVTEIKNPDFSE